MKIYKQYEALSPIYKGGLTNHLPMVLTALRELGLSEEEIVTRLDTYRDEKGILDLTETTTPINDYEQEYVNLTSKYLGEINHKSVDVVLGEFINKYKWNLESALYHGLIRLAYAKQEKNSLMIAQAMAYFELSSESIELPRGKTCSVNEFEVAYPGFLTQFKNMNFEFKSRSSMDKFKELLDLEIISDNLFTLRDVSREIVLETILKKYMKTNCFYNLHVITGFEALLELEEYIFDFNDVLNHFFKTAQLFMLFNMDEIEDKGENDLSFEELTSEVRALNDAHDIKLFYTLLKLNKLIDNKDISKIANRIFK